MEKSLIIVTPELLQGIRSGMRSCLIVDENETYLVNTEIEIHNQEVHPDSEIPDGVVCGINSITTSAGEPGLKKGNTLICVSVIRSL